MSNTCDTNSDYQVGRQINRQKDKLTHGQKDKQTHRQKDKQTHRQTKSSIKSF